MFFRWFVAVFIIFAFALADAQAHPVPFSYLDVQLQPSSVDIALTIHIYDLAHDLQVTPMERLLEPGFLKEREAAIRQLLTPRFEVDADGRRLTFEWLDSDILTDRQSVRFHLHYAGTAPGKASVSALMFPYDENHQTFVNVYENDALSSQVLLDRNH